MCEDADGCNDIESHDIARAQKRHICSGCGSAILPGQFYTRSSVLYDGHWSSWKHCGRCARLMEELLDKHGAYTAVDPEFCCGLTWRDAFDEDPPEEIQALAFVNPNEASAMLEEAYRKQHETRAEVRRRQRLVQT